MGGRIAVCILVATGIVFSGCQRTVQKALGESTWQQKHGWKAEDYFDDAQVIALCNAIEKNDLAEIDRLVAVGADVNAKGKGNMTPLLWAFFDNKLDRFKRLLAHGADPNVVLNEEFGVRGWGSAGESVTHMACATKFPGYFEAVFAHGGDPNLISTVRTAMSDSTLHAVINGKATDKLAKVNLLIDKGADLNHVDGRGLTPAMAAVVHGPQFEIVLALLEAGADYRMYQPNELSRLIHLVARQKSPVVARSPMQQARYDAVVKWLDDHGESLESAQADLDRWASWGGTPESFEKGARAEIAARKAREAKEKSRAAEATKAND